MSRMNYDIKCFPLMVSFAFRSRRVHWTTRWTRFSTYANRTPIRELQYTTHKTSIRDMNYEIIINKSLASVSLQLQTSLIEKYSSLGSHRMIIAANERIQRQWVEKAIVGPNDGLLCIRLIKSETIKSLIKDCIESHYGFHCDTSSLSYENPGQYNAVIRSKFY